VSVPDFMCKQLLLLQTQQEKLTRVQKSASSHSECARFFSKKKARAASFGSFWFPLLQGGGKFYLDRASVNNIHISASASSIAGGGIIIVVVIWILCRRIKRSI